MYIIFVCTVENYTLGEQKHVDTECPLQIQDGAIHMKVTCGKKIRNLVTFALKKIEEEEVRQMSWSGRGGAISKTLSCVELLKRKYKGLHQITDVRFNRVEEYWEPKIEGLDRLKVNKDVPAVTVLLSKDELDTTHPSYQAPGSTEPFSNRMSQPSTTSQAANKTRRNKPQGSGSGNQFAAPSMDRKRKRKGFGGGGETGEGNRHRGQKGKNKPKDKSKQKDKKSEAATSEPQKMDTSSEQKSAFMDKLDQITKVT